MIWLGSFPLSSKALLCRTRAQYTDNSEKSQYSCEYKGKNTNHSPQTIMNYTLIVIKWVVSYHTECFSLNQGDLKIKNSCLITAAPPGTRQVHVPQDWLVVTEEKLWQVPHPASSPHWWPDVQGHLLYLPSWDRITIKVTSLKAATKLHDKQVYKFLHFLYSLYHRILKVSKNKFNNHDLITFMEVDLKYSFSKLRAHLTK